MNRLTKLVVAFITILASLTLFVSADGVYSSQDDPLISLSYANDVLAPEIMSQIISKIEKDYVKISDISAASAGSYSYLSLNKNQTLMAKSCCEIILLDGKAVTVITSVTNVKTGIGLCDLTSGKTIENGSTLSANHYVVIPKADGRGFTVSSDHANILVRGEYNITG